MSLNTFIKLSIKAFNYAVTRPLQRFNVYNRAKKYLGPEAKYFSPAPRAIGAMSQSDGKPIQYPKLEAGQQQSSSDDALVVSQSNKLEVKKLVSGDEKTQLARPLPKLTSLIRQDLSSIWLVDKTPPGRLNINQLQEIMINKLADDKYWTAEKVSEKYNIKEEYAENILKYLKQIRIVVSPKMKHLLDYVGANDTYYQSAKHLVYHVDNRLRNDVDKQYDDMFLPNEQWSDEVKEILDTPETKLQPLVDTKRIVKRPEPLRLGPINKPKEIE